MPALASCAAHAFTGDRTSSSLKRPRGVVAVAPVARGKMAQQEKLARRVVACTKPSAPPAEKRAVHVVLAPPPPPPRHLKERTVETEHAAREGREGMDGARTMAADEAAKRRKTSSSKPASQALHQRTRTEPAKQQPRLDQQRERPMSKLIEKGKEALKRRRLEEIARAREKSRLELIEVEKAAMPDETIYPEDLEELGLTAFQYAVTPTRKQAQRRRLG